MFTNENTVPMNIPAPPHVELVTPSSVSAFLTHCSASQMTPVFALVTHTSPPFFAAILTSLKDVHL